MLSWVPTWLRRTFAVLVLGLVVWLFVIPQFDEASDALDTIQRVNPLLIAAGVLLVAVAFGAQAEMTRSVLPAHCRPGRLDMVRIELASAAVSHTVPGGTAAGSALGFRLLTRAGVGSTDAGFAVGARGVGSSLMLNLLLWLALVIWIPIYGFTSLLGTAGLVGAILLTLAGAIAITIMRARSTASRVLTAIVRPLPFIDEERVPEVVERIGERLDDVLRDTSLALRLAAWGAVYWLSEAAALYLFLWAFGSDIGPLSLMVAVGLVNVLAVVPITPRGLGILEAVLIPTLVSMGTPTSIATLGVISWRLLQFWLPIPLGALSYVSLRVHEPDAGDDRDDRDDGEDRDEHRRAAAAELAEARKARHRAGAQA